MTRARRATGTLLLVLASLGLGECAARWIFPEPEIVNFNRIDFTPVGLFGGIEKVSGAEERASYGPRRPLRNVEISWVSAPDGIENVLHLNLYGFRGDDFPVQPPADRTRVLFLGDSFVEGFGADEDETLPRVFEALSQGGVEALNLGIGGADLGDIERLARVAVPLLHPEVVILVVAWNDLPAPPPEPPPREPFAPRVRPWWMPRLVTVVLDLVGGDTPALFYHRGPYPFFLPVPHPSNPLSGEPDDDRIDPDILAAMRRGTFNPYLRNAAPLLEHSRRLPFGPETDGSGQLQRIVEIVRANGASLIATYAPAHVTISDAYLPLWNRLGGHFQRATLVTPEFRREQRILGRFFAERDVPFVDPTDALAAEEAAGHRLFAGYDGHLNPDGYALLAGLLHEAYVQGKRHQ